jgi:hypothetical protein
LDIPQKIKKIQINQATGTMNNKITPAQQNAYLDIKAKADAAIKVAKTAAERKTLRDSFIRNVGIAMGAGAVGVKAADIVFGSN